MKKTPTLVCYSGFLDFEYGKECPDCLRWFVPILDDDPCVYCERWGIPPYPNRIRSLGAAKGLTCGEIARRGGFKAPIAAAILNGKTDPQLKTKKKILKGLGLRFCKKHLYNVFPAGKNLI